MPITKDLKANEFELTFDCQEKECKVKTTFAYDNDAKQWIGDVRKEARRRVKKAHEEGRHDTEIMVCNTHETPLIWTFKFPYAEYYCMSGNHSGGAFGTGKTVPSTPELIALRISERKIWDSLSPHIAIGRFWRKDCPKCTTDGDNYHLKHMTDQEKQASVDALAKLEEYANAQA